MNGEHSSDMEALRKSDERNRLLLDTLKHGVQLNDCEGVITYSNRAHHRMLQYDFGELLGTKVWDRQSSPAEKESLRKYLAYLVKEQPTPTAFVTKSRRRDGTLVEMQVDWNYERDADGTLRGFISVITDITNRVKTEESLRHRIKGFAALLEVSKSLGATLDLKNVLQMTVDGVTKLVGLDTAAIYLLEGDRLHLWATTPPLPPQFPYELRIAPLADHPYLQRAIASGEPVHVPDMTTADLTPAERSVTKQRNLRTLLYLPLIADVETMGVLIVGSVGTPSPIMDAEIDLSSTLANLAALAVKNAQLYREGQEHADQLEQTLADRKRVEEERGNLQKQLAQAHKLESIGRLAGGVAHDFNNMLNVILGHLEMVMMQVKPSDLVYADLQEIQRAAERSANLTQQLLAFARKQTVTPEVLDLNGTIEGMFKMLRRMIREDIDLKWLPEEDLWAVRIDPAQIDQILVNLCVNSSDAIAGVGKITIEVRNVAFDEASCADHPGFIPGEFVALSVSDSGCGMDREALEKIFEPFFTTKETGQGTGLGLATVYGIVKQNNGFINVYSEPDKGTTFNIYLPRNLDQTEKIATVKRAEPDTGRRETVLFVEDEQALLNIGKRMLEMQGYKVLTAITPGEAIRLAVGHAEVVQLLITDVVMPEMNGWELARKLQSIYPNIKYLFMSGYTADVIAERGELEEGIHFIQKPFSMQGLAEKVLEALGPEEVNAKE